MKLLNNLKNKLNNNNKSNINKNDIISSTYKYDEESIDFSNNIIMKNDIILNSPNGLLVSPTQNFKLCEYQTKRNKFPSHYTQIPHVLITNGFSPSNASHTSIGGPPSNKKVVSFCISESIDIMGCYELLESKGFKPQPYKNFFFFFIKKSNSNATNTTTASVQSRSRENSPRLMSSPLPNEIELDKIETHSNINNINVPPISPANNLYGFSLDRQQNQQQNQYLHPNYYHNIQQHKSPIINSNNNGNINNSNNNQATPNNTSMNSQSKLEEFDKNHSLVVVYEYGVVVCWDLPQNLQVRTLALFENYTQGPLNSKLVDEMTFDRGFDQTCILKDQIFLSDFNYDTKISISHSLSQSIKISLLEEQFNKILYLTKNIPSQLVKKGTVGISHPQLGVVVGGVFKIKKSISKNSVLFKSVSSNYFSQNPTNKQAFNLSSNYLEIKDRTHSINNNISSVNDMVSVCRSELETKSSYRLEMTVIILIFFELLFMILQFIYSIK